MRVNVSFAVIAKVMTPDAVRAAPKPPRANCATARVFAIHSSVACVERTTLAATAKALICRGPRGRFPSARLAVRRVAGGLPGCCGGSDIPGYLGLGAPLAPESGGQVPWCGVIPLLPGVGGGQAVR